MQKLQGLWPFLGQVKFYRDKLQEAGVKTDRIRCLADLEKIPFTTKQELRRSHPMERTADEYDGVAFFFASSGTTGPPTTYPWSPKDDRVLQEVAARCMKRIGVVPQDMSLLLVPFGLPIMWYCMVTQYRTVGAGVVPLGIAAPEKIAAAINEYPISVITTMPVGGTRLFEYMRTQGIALTNNRLRQFHLGGDYLSDAKRERIEAYWNVDCLNFYGLSEVFGPIAGECPAKNGLHFASDYVLLEVVDPKTGKAVPDGAVGVAVYSTLWDKGAPLLRYWSGDYVSLTWDRCQCGETSPRITFRGRSGAGNDTRLRGNPIFARDIEEVILRFPGVSDEWALVVEGFQDNPEAVLFLERVPDERPDTKNLRAVLSDYLSLSVRVSIKPTGTFDRHDFKPKRILDKRT